MKIVIKNRWHGTVIFECEAESIREACEKASRQQADLRGAVLSDADLRGAVLRGAVLSDAVLGGADLSGAVLRDAVLSGAVLRNAVLSGAVLRGAVLSGADLSGAVLGGAVLRDAVLGGAVLGGADLRGAVLSGAVLSGAVLRDADLSDAVGINLSGVPKIENIHKAIYEAASREGALDMGSWHSCETTHCRAGWAVHLAGPAGRAMEFCLGTPAAAALIYMASDPKLEKVPDFYASNSDALADMKLLAEKEEKTVRKFNRRRRWAKGERPECRNCPGVTATAWVQSGKRLCTNCCNHAKRRKEYKPSADGRKPDERVGIIRLSP